MRKNYAIYSLNMNCVMCKIPLIGIDKFGRTTKSIHDSMYPLDYLKCPKCNREYFLGWDTENKTLIPISYRNIDTFMHNLNSKLSKG